MFCCFFQHVIQILKNLRFSLNTIYFSSKVHTCICENWHSLIFFLFFQFYIPFVQERIPWSVFFLIFILLLWFLFTCILILLLLFLCCFLLLEAINTVPICFPQIYFCFFFLFKFAYLLSSLIIATQCFHLRTNSHR